MTVEETGEEDGEGLPQGHDDGENRGAKLINGVEDKELAARRAHGQQDGVKGKLGVAGHEGERVKEGALLQQRAHGEEAGEHVDPEHHLHRRHLVLEEVVLPVGGEAVEDDVAREDEEPAEGGDSGRVFAGVAGQQEHADAHGDQHGGKILPVLVALVGDDFTHQHHRNDFGGLGEHLSGEADVFEGLVLAPAAEDVGEGREGVLVHGRPVARLVEREAPQPGHGQSQDPVHEDQELRVCELLPRLFWSGSVGARHHSLLQDSPRQVGHLDMDKLGLKSLLKKTHLNIFK